MSEHNAGHVTAPSTPIVNASQFSSASLPRNQNSPLYRFLSSLSHHCTSPASSTEHSYLDGSTSSSSNDGRVFDDGLNNYGMIRHGLVSKCKQCLGKLRHYGGRLSEENLRPFVVPTVIADARNESEGGRLVVDVTPRLVAYFEVTIVKQGHADSAQNESVNGRTNQPNRNHMDMSILPPRIREVPAQAGRPNNLWRMPHRAVFMPMNLPLILGANNAPFGPPAHHDRPIRQPRQLQHQMQRLGNNNDGRRQRHECVAIGLSTSHFRPTNKMPGWDMESYGYHGDDGGIFHGQGDMLRRYGPSFGPGDTIGCGLEYSTRRMFFVKNGVFLGYAFGSVGLPKDVVEGGLYPTVGVDTECPIFVNFGESPFKFDMRGFATESGAEGDKESL